MVNSTLRHHHLRHVSYHVNQTLLVDKLLDRQLIDYDDIHCLYEDTDVYQWLVFVNFGQYDYEKLEEAGIPYIASEI